MRSLLAVLVLTAACSAGTERDDTTDGGSTTKTDGGTTTTDGGSDPVDAGGGWVAESCTTPDLEEPCSGSSEGSCDPGVRRCTDGKWTVCEGRKQPAPGYCDSPNCATGLENTGCECRIGTTKDCYSGDIEVLGKGPCRKGFSECIGKAGGSVWGPCKGDVLPAATDDCSGRELDCNLADPGEACACTGGQTRPCGGVTGGSCVLGTQTCSGDTWGDCVGAVQPVAGDCAQDSCLGKPNPGCACTIGKTEPCYTGPVETETVGTCHAGTRTCGSNAQWGACGGQDRPTPYCDLHAGPTCTGQLGPGCK